MARKSRSQIWLEYAAVRVLLGTLGAMPRRASLWVSISLARAAFRLLKSLRRTAMRNLEIAFPEMASAEREKLASANPLVSNLPT